MLLNKLPNLNSSSSIKLVPITYRLDDFSLPFEKSCLEDGFDLYMDVLN